MTGLLVALLAVQNVGLDIDRAVTRGIAEGIYPAAVVVVGTRDSVLFARGYGHFTWDTLSRVPDPDSTLFDLASLTKVVATTASVMVLADRGRLALRRPVSDYLSGFVGEGKERVTVRHLLEHRSGLRAFLPLNTLASDAEEARRLVETEPLRWEPAGRVVYSDLNGMLLGWVVEAVAGEQLDRFATRAVFELLGMTETRFRPPRSARARIVPVGLWRGHPIAGEIHDQNAVRLGGVSGHAGLYSTGRDLARYAQFMLRQGRSASGEQVVRTGATALFTRRGQGNRALGWEMRDTTTADNAGTLFSPASYGHTGYTGTSMWLDPERDLFVIVLTNRVYAPRTRRSISGLKRVRGEVADAAVGLWSACRRATAPETGCR